MPWPKMMFSFNLWTFVIPEVQRLARARVRYQLLEFLDLFEALGDFLLVIGGPRSRERGLVAFQGFAQLEGVLPELRVGVVRDLHGLQRCGRGVHCC